MPAYAIVGGNPATVLRYRFDAATIARLEALRGWDWDAAKIMRNVRAICGADIAALDRAV